MGLISAFWSCGDNQIIEFAILRARLNDKEKKILECILDKCLTQEETAEVLNLSTRTVQSYWKSAINKLLGIEWVRAYAEYLNRVQSV